MPSLAPSWSAEPTPRVAIDAVGAGNTGPTAQTTAQTAAKATRTTAAPAPRRPLGVLVKMFPKLSETFVLEELLGLERRGLALKVYTLASPTDAVVQPAVARLKAPVVQVPEGWAQDPLGMAVRHAALALAHPRRYWRAWRLASARGAAGRRDAWRAGWLAAQMAADGVGHLHSHFLSQPTDVAELAAAFAGHGYSVSAHAKDIYLGEPADLARKLRGARFTVTCTECNRLTLSDIAPDAPVHRMYHGIDHAAFHPALRRADAGPPLIVSVGRLKAKKGLDVLIDACARLQREGRDFRCDIVGYGDEREALTRQIVALGLSGLIRLPGKLARDGVIDRYARAAVYVQPSRITADGDRDGIPNVLLEAMAMGLPVVASAVSGIPELVHDGANGLLVPADDAQALARAIARVLDDPALCADLGAQARATVVRDFDNDRNLRQVIGLLDLLESDDAKRLAAIPA